MSPFLGVEYKKVPPMIYPVDMVHGACFSIKSESLKRLKGFDEYMNPYNFDEMDLAIRAKKLGLRILADTRTYVRHLGGGTTGRINKTLRGYLFIRHMFRSMFRNEGKKAYFMIPFYIALLFYAVPAGGYGNPIIAFKAFSWALKNRNVPLKADEISEFIYYCISSKM